MLIKRKALFPILRCPVTGQKLFKKRNEYEFKYYTKNRENMYDICNGVPLLIDDKSSIVSLQDLKSFKPLVSRKIYKGFFSFTKKLTSPSKTRTKENVNLLISELSNIKEIPKVLIIGGGTVGQGMDYFYTSSNIDLVSFDIYNSSNINFIADAHQIPLPKNYFDAVIIQAVLEHVLEPCEVVKEIYRVLKPRGIVYAETPFLWLPLHLHLTAVRLVCNGGQNGTASDRWVWMCLSSFASTTVRMTARFRKKCMQTCQTESRRGKF